MPSTNGHGPKQAILYTRVSGDAQRDHGYSLSDQRRELKEWAAKEGYEVLEEVEDGAWSGGDLVRPGLDRVRDLVVAGGVDIVVTLFRDRIARGVYAGLLAQEFAEHGCRLIALNAQVDDSPEGELHGGMLDIVAAWERKKIAERTRRGKLEKARKGMVIAGRSPRYGFRLNTARDGYEVDEEKMAVVHRIFSMVAGGATLRSIKLALDREGVLTPKGAKFWDRSFFRRCVLDDVYKPHSLEEVAPVTSPEVAAGLDPSKHYGVWWFNQRRMTSKQISEASENGRRYGRKYSSYTKPKEEWIAVPVPDSGIPRELVDAARAAIKDNCAPSRAGGRFWELSGGIARCGACGRRLRATHRKKRRKSGSISSYGYYKCSGHSEHGEERCTNRRSISAKVLEEKAWRFVRAVMMDPGELTADLDRMIELKRRGQRGDPQKEAKAWLEELAKLERMRDGYHDQAAEGLMSLEKLREKIAALEEKQAVAGRELATLKGRGEEIERLERDRDAVLEYYTALAPEALDALVPEERHRLYGMLGLKILVGEDGKEWAEMLIRPPEELGANPGVCLTGVTSRSARMGVR